MGNTSIVLNENNNSFVWNPSRSAPSCRLPIPELSKKIIPVLQRLDIHSIVDYGCGYGRNIITLSEYFETIYMIEVEAMIDHIKSFISSKSLHNCCVLETQDFAKSCINADACLLSCVLHTIPTSELRSQILYAIYKNLRIGGILVAVTPANDRKYSDSYIGQAKKYSDGIVRLHSDGCFTFYKNYSSIEFSEQVTSHGFIIDHKLSGDHRYIIIARKENSI